MKQKIRKVPDGTSIANYLLNQVNSFQYSRVELTRSAYLQLLKDDDTEMENEVVQEGMSEKSFSYNPQNTCFPEMSFQIVYNGIYLISIVQTVEKQYLFSGNTNRTLVIDY